MEKTFRTNIFAYFFMAKAALPHLKDRRIDHQHHVGDRLQGQPAAARLLVHQGRHRRLHPVAGQSLAEKNIRVNGVAPGPIWTPLIPSTFPEEKVENFGGDVPLGRAGQPEEVAPCYVFLASDDASYMTGQVLHPNGGSVVNG